MRFMTEWKESCPKMDKLDNVSIADDSKLLSSLGLCARARALVIGTPMVIEALRKSGAEKPRIVLEAADTSDNTHKKILDKCAYYKVRHVRLGCGTAELSDAVGKSSSVAAVAVCDDNFYKLILQYLKLDR